MVGEAARKAAAVPGHGELAVEGGPGLAWRAEPGHSALQICAYVAINAQSDSALQCSAAALPALRGAPLPPLAPPGAGPPGASAKLANLRFGVKAWDQMYSTKSGTVG